MQRQFWTAFGVLCLLLALSGCAAHRPAGSVAVPEAEPDALFSEEVAALPEDAPQFFADTPFGPAATIGAGPLYHSGLGQECRLTRITRQTTSHTFALCRGEDGAWRFAPAIFEGEAQ